MGPGPFGLWDQGYLIPRSYTATKQNRAFLAAGPSIWNGLPLELRSLPRDLWSSFYSLLKTFLFARRACIRVHWCFSYCSGSSVRSDLNGKSEQSRSSERRHHNHDHDTQDSPTHAAQTAKRQKHRYCRSHRRFRQSDASSGTNSNWVHGILY